MEFNAKFGANGRIFFSLANLGLISQGSSTREFKS